MDNHLFPSISSIRHEYVLVQAWKKASSYIRYHNWYSDTLELDRASINLRSFLSQISAKLETPEKWEGTALRVVPAPKTQRWSVDQNDGSWEPIKSSKDDMRLRPLAHVSLIDQVVSTAIMLCLADRVETLQGDPKESIQDPHARVRVISYGNRLFCDNVNGELRHRWGSGKLYRAYYQDYRTFLSRPEVVAKYIQLDKAAKIVIVHSDLKQFYDRVSPELLRQKIRSLVSEDEPEFLELTSRALNWAWHDRDKPDIERYAHSAGIEDFTRVVLPQGLVAAGFFANVALLDFDNCLRKQFSKEIETGITLHDACRYVDDLRLVLTVPPQMELTDVEKIISSWLTKHLNDTAPGLVLSPEKTIAAMFHGDERPIVQQSQKMARIQGAVSGGFDANSGLDILDAVQGLIRSQERYSPDSAVKSAWSLSPIADVRDSTVARFAAGRYRSTYRSLRPLLYDAGELFSNTGENQTVDSSGAARTVRTRSDLDNDAKAFALGLIEGWVNDPSNVRLLRIGLDLWPAKDVLSRVLALLRPYTNQERRRYAPRRVAWYCLAEIFRAGATETGFVEDSESLPQGVDIEAYRAELRNEARRIVEMSNSAIPWYLRQQALLFLAANSPDHAPFLVAGRNPESKHYRELIRYLRGDDQSLTGADFATYAVLARRSFRDSQGAIFLASRSLTTRKLELITERDPAFALELSRRNPKLRESLSPRVRDDLGLHQSGTSESFVSLTTIVAAHAGSKSSASDALRNELSLLRFSTGFLEQISTVQEQNVIVPSDIFINMTTIADNGRSIEVRVRPSRVSEGESIYAAPKWVAKDERWRFQLGYLLRFILTGQPDFTLPIRAPHWKTGTATYRPPGSHWYQRLYGMFNGHGAFGDDWVPVSDWVERLLSALMRWPGSRESFVSKWLKGGAELTKEKIEGRSKYLRKLKGNFGLDLLPVSVHWQAAESASRPLRACVVQTVMPNPDPSAGELKLDDLTLSKLDIRRKHRNHLSAALAAVSSMVALRETHKGRDGRLDLLILPELAVHPKDVKTHLIPFARANKTIILAGLTYEELFLGEPLINSAIWIVPVWSAADGLQVMTRRQGKYHLSPEELKLNKPDELVQGFRPCQWLVEYKWSGKHSDEPLKLTAAICYDATDLSLVAQLRGQADVFAIPALNKDVGTFDQMALALHYHMFQTVIVANNGLFGGSNAYAPYKEAFKRQVFHMHGQPQASIAFLEIDDPASYVARLENAKILDENREKSIWKYPPAGI